MLTGMEVHGNENYSQLLKNWFIHGPKPNDTSWIRWIEGLDPVKADLSTVDFASGHGGLIIGHRVPMRQITITFGLKPGVVSAARDELNSVFQIGSTVYLRFNSTNGLKDTQGRVEDVIAPMFSKDSAVQVVITCPDPHFYGPELVRSNPGNTADTGAFTVNGVRGGKLRIVVNVTTASSTAKDYRVGTTEKALVFRRARPPISGSAQAGDQFIIESELFKKRATRNRSGTIAPLYNAINLGLSDWPELIPGTNGTRIRWSFDDSPTVGWSGATLTVYYREAYLGL